MLFLYSGLVTSHDVVPYRGIWDIKPPLTHELTAGLAAISGYDPTLLLLLGALLASATWVATSLLTAAVTFEITDCNLAAVAAGLSILAFPRLVSFGTYNVRSKTFAAFFGILSLYLLVDERALAAAAAGTVAAGFWQSAVLFPAVIIGGHIYRRDWQTVALDAGTVTILTGFVVSPFILRGAVTEMVVQTVFAPAVTPTDGGIVETLRLVGVRLKLVGVFVAGGGIGALFTARSGQYQRAWWLFPLSSLYVLQALVFNLNGVPDLLPGYFLAAIGIGVLVNELPRRRQYQALAGILMLGVVMLVWVSVADWYSWVVTPGDFPMSAFWEGAAPSSCHVQRSGKELAFVAMRDGVLSEAQCGPYRLSRWLPGWRYVLGLVSAVDGLSIGLAAGVRN